MKILHLAYSFFIFCIAWHSYSKDPGWKLIYKQDFESGLRLEPPGWEKEQYTEKGKYSDSGTYFKKNPNFSLPTAYRTSYDMDWLRFELYSRGKKPLESFLNIEPDPENPKNKVLRLTTKEHTDGFTIGSSRPLPKEYKVCAKGGYASFGNGSSLPNGYDGDETAEPWISGSSINENGHYWIAITTDPPRPRNNVWIHHHRKVVIDSDNNYYPKEKISSWTRIWDGKKYISSGNRPVMMFVLDSKNKEKSWNFDRVGMPFISYSAGKWNSQATVNEIRAVDAYLPNEWYRYCIWKTNNVYGLQISGKFRFGGTKTYRSEISLNRVYKALSKPDHFLLGDPHINFYEGSVLYDEIEIYSRK